MWSLIEAKILITSFHIFIIERSYTKTQLVEAK